MNDIIISSNKYVLAYRANAVLFASLFEATPESTINLGYDLTGQTNYELFDNDVDMQLRITELFPNAWEYPAYAKRFIIGLKMVTEYLSDRISDMKTKGLPYAFINQDRAVVMYHNIWEHPEDEQILISLGAILEDRPLQ